MNVESEKADLLPEIIPMDRDHKKVAKMGARNESIKHFNEETQGQVSVETPRPEILEALKDLEFGTMKKSSIRF